MGQLQSLRRTATRFAASNSLSALDIEAAHGLEQQLVEALIECLETAELQPTPHSDPRCRAILAQFEAFLRDEPIPRMADICAAIGVSRLSMSACCRNVFGVGADRYRLVSGLQRVHDALRSGDPATPTVAAAVRRFGFDRMSHFAAQYRILYGELPSVTLHGRKAAGTAAQGRRNQTPD
jgi:AraC family ethanolamine operon transcriptional activator